MVKKRIVSKEPSEGEEKHGKEEVKPVAKPRKLGKEIDEIFGDRKRKKLEVQKEKTIKGSDSIGGSNKNLMNKKQKKMKKSGVEKKKSRKRTEDGLVVYTEEELGVNKSNAGFTPLCPFDCDCCF